MFLTKKKEAVLYFNTVFITECKIHFRREQDFIKMHHKSNLKRDLV